MCNSTYALKSKWMAEHYADKLKTVKKHENHSKYKDGEFKK